MKKFILMLMLAIGVLAFPGCDQEGEQVTVSEQERMDAFEQMVAGDYSEEDVIHFADENIEFISPESASRVILKLEDVQRKLQEERMNELFAGDIQKRLNEQTQKPVIDSPADVVDQDLKELVQRMKDRGYVLTSMEGMYYQVIDYEKYKNYSARATDDIKAYVDIMAAEFSEFAMMDAHPMISKDNLLGRIMNAEEFLENYPDSKKFDEIKELYSYYAGIYLYGFSFDLSNNKLSQEAMESYEKALGINEDSNFAALFREYYEVLKSEGYTLTETVDAKRREMLDNILKKYEVEEKQN